MFFRKKEGGRCAVCGRELQHRHRPMQEWGIDGFLCGDCHLDLMRDYYVEGKAPKKSLVKCGLCGKEVDPEDAYEAPRRLNLRGTLCRECFEGKEEKKGPEHCAICGKKLGFLRYNPKKKWRIDGHLCRRCWDAQNIR
ncbi:MAG: hypothetical protein ACE5JV_03045 [Nitrososphaerales archaeon]